MMMPSTLQLTSPSVLKQRLTTSQHCNISQMATTVIVTFLSSDLWDSSLMIMRWLIMLMSHKFSHPNFFVRLYKIVFAQLTSILLDPRQTIAWWTANSGRLELDGFLSSQCLSSMMSCTVRWLLTFWHASSVVPPLIPQRCDIRLHHHVALLHN